MTGTVTPSIWRWDQTSSGGRETSPRGLTVHFPEVAPGTPISVGVLDSNHTLEVKDAIGSLPILPVDGILMDITVKDPSHDT
jgi:hypothetical protein